MDFSIIIVNYNLSDEICSCIDSLYKYLNLKDFEIIIFDNNSAETSINLLKQKIYSVNSNNISLILNDKNIGFGQACNLASLKASGKILLFLNPDTMINIDILNLVKPAFYKSINKDCVIGLNVHENKYLDYSAGYFPNLFFEILNIFSLGRVVEAFYIKVLTILFNKKKMQVDWVMGASIFIPKILFEDIRGFDSDYFLYFEELDLFKRIKKNGYPIYYFPNISIKHVGSVSTKKNYYFFTKLFYKGKLLYLQKHSSKLKLIIFKLLILFHFINQIFLWFILRIKYPGKANGKIKAFKELIWYINNPLNIPNNS